MIRVLHVIGSMNRGGAEAMIMNLYRQIDRAKVQFDFVEHSNEKAIFDDEIESMGGQVYRCPRFNGKNYFRYKKWWDDFFVNEGNEYQIVHGHIGSTAAIYSRSAKDHGKYVIVHSHNTKGDWSLKEGIYRILAKRVVGIADYFFACSNQAGKDRFGGKQKFEVLNNAIDIEEYTFSENIRAKVREELNVKDVLVIGHVGRFNEQKNHMFLIDVFAEIKKIKTNVKLLLVGDGIGKQAVEEKVYKLGLEKDVIFAGVRSDVNRLMQAMDIFVFPSIYEGLGVALVEAQAAGLPCVVSDKIQDDAIVVRGLVIKKSLNDLPEDWAKDILSKVNIPRENTAAEVKNHGYDIKATAKWLEQFYSEKVEE